MLVTTVCIAFLMVFSMIPFAGLGYHQASRSAKQSVADYSSQRGSGHNNSSKNNGVISPDMFPRPPGGGGGTTPSTVTYTYNIGEPWLSGGTDAPILEISIGGKNYVPGSQITLNTDQTYGFKFTDNSRTYGYFESNGITLDYWYTTSGSVQNVSYSSGNTNWILTPGNQNGILLAVTSSPANWGGAVANNFIQLQFSGASAIVKIPSVSYSGSGINALGIWTGVGGVGNLQEYDYFWQAGLAVNVTAGGQETVIPWWEAYNGVNNGPLNNPHFYNSESGVFSPGDSVNISVSVAEISGGGQIGYYSIHDLTNDKSWSGSVPNLRSTYFNTTNFDQLNSAEAVVEVPPSSHDVIINAPLFYNVDFSSIYFDTTSGNMTMAYAPTYMDEMCLQNYDFTTDLQLGWDQFSIVGQL